MVKSIDVWKFSGANAPFIEPVKFEQQVSSLDDATRLLPSGGYTTFRTYCKSRVLRFDEHVQRLEETARLAGNPRMLDQHVYVTGLKRALELFEGDEARVRVCMDLTEEIGALYLLLEPLHTPADEDYRNGVRVVTRQMQRENPKAKLTAFIATAATIRQELPAGTNEALMIGVDGRVLEGLSSNFFAVKEGVIMTAQDGVLSGITRTLALEVIHEKDLPLRLEALLAADLPTVDEAFITSASRAVLPVVEIDGRPVGNGLPGPITQAVLDGYLQRIDRELDCL